MAGANLLVAHGGGPTAVINASLVGVIREARRRPGIDRILAAIGGIDGVLRGEVVDLTDLDEESLARLERTPASAIGSCRHKVVEADFPRIERFLDRNRVAYFLYNGGNDSMDTCMRLHERMPGLGIAGIPKTIDNDLAATDHSPGFGSAARYYAVSTAELCLDTIALGIQVSVLEVMGRNAGWLAASSSLARSLEPQFPLMVLVPERPFDSSRFLAASEEHFRRGERFVVVASEGLADDRGVVLGAAGGSESIDAFGHRMPGGVGEYLAGLLREQLGIRARAEKPGLLGRASKALVSGVDRGEAELCGRHAVAGVCEGANGFMVALKRTSDSPYAVEPALVDLAEVANVERKLPAEYLGGDPLDVSPAFLPYCRPLVGDDPLASYYRILRPG